MIVITPEIRLAFLQYLKNVVYQIKNLFRLYSFYIGKPKVLRNNFYLYQLQMLTNNDA